MKISIIGTGRMGLGLVRSLAPHIKSLHWGSRTPEKPANFIHANGWTNVIPASYEEALDADVIIHTLWFRDLLPWAEAHKRALSGKLLVDVANPFTDDFLDFTLDWGHSAAERLQQTLPDTRIVGAFKNTFFRVLEEPVHDGQVSDVFVTSDDPAARETVLQLLEPLPFRFLDGGVLSNNRTIERMTLFSRELAVRYGHYPYVSYRMFGMPDPCSRTL